MIDLTQFTPWTLFTDLGFISILLLVGKFIRVKVKLIQQLFIPPSLIAGLLGLAFGPSLIITRMAGRTPVPEKESIESFASHHATMAVYLSAGHLKELSKRLMAGGYSEDTPAAIVYKATWPEQLCLKCTVSTLDEEAEKYGIKKTAVVLVGDAISPSDYALSCLYAPDFETEYRKKKTEEALALDGRGK